MWAASGGIGYISGVYVETSFVFTYDKPFRILGEPRHQLTPASASFTSGWRIPIAWQLSYSTNGGSSWIDLDPSDFAPNFGVRTISGEGTWATSYPADSTFVYTWIRPRLYNTMMPPDGNAAGNVVNISTLSVVNTRGAQLPALDPVGKMWRLKNRSYYAHDSQSTWTIESLQTHVSVTVIGEEE